MLSFRSPTSRNLFQPDPKQILYRRITHMTNRVIEDNNGTRQIYYIASTINMFLNKAMKDPAENRHTISDAILMLLTEQTDTNEFYENLKAILAPYANTPVGEDTETFTLEI